MHSKPGYIEGMRGVAVLVICSFVLTSAIMLACARAGASAVLLFLNSASGILYFPTVAGMFAALVLDRRRGETSTRFALWAYIILPLSLMVLQPILLDLTTSAAARNIDHELAHWDETLFGAPAFVWSKFIWVNQWRMVVVSLWYASLPTMMAIGTATARRPSVAFAAYVALGLGSGALYWCFPALGPAQAIEGFPWLGQVWLMTPQGVCNGFPSMHTAGAMVALFCAPRRLLPAWSIYAVGIVFCCVSTGQHWLVDCIAGVMLARVLVSALSMAALTGWAAPFLRPSGAAYR
jgi:PAP2 superfamily